MKSKICRSPKAEVISMYFFVTNDGLQLQVGYTTPVIKMLIRHQNIKSIPELNFEIIRRSAEVKSPWHFYGLHLHICDIWLVTDCLTNNHKGIFPMFCFNEAFQLKNYLTVHAFIIIKIRNIQMLCNILVCYLQENFDLWWVTIYRTISV